MEDGMKATDREQPQAQRGAESTIELLDHIKQGDETAINRLCERQLPTLKRWARGRLPGFARDMRDTEDLVQDTVMHTLRRLTHFEPRGRGALQAYLRQGVMNRIRDEVRRVGRRGPTDELDAAERPDEGASPLEHAIGREGFRRYREALATLRPEESVAIRCRLELGYSYAEVAEALGKSSPDAARMTVTRALQRLTEILGSREPRHAV